MWACNVVGTVLGPRRWAKARNVALELDSEEKEAENNRVRGQQTRGPSLVVQREQWNGSRREEGWVYPRVGAEDGRHEN